MSAIYKCCNASELNGVLVAGVVAKSSIEHDLKGKYHKRGLYCLRLLQLKERDNLGNKLKKILRFRRTSISQDNCAATHAALEDDDNLNSLGNNQLFHSGRGYYWRDFLHAVHACNWDEYVDSLCAMLPWL